MVRETCIQFAGARVPGEAGRLPRLGLAATKEMPPDVCLSRFWQLTPNFDDGVFRGHTEGAEDIDWLASRQALRRAIVSGDLSLPSLVEVVGIIVSVGLLIVSLMKETGRKTDGDILVV